MMIQSIMTQVVLPNLLDDLQLTTMNKTMYLFNPSVPIFVIIKINNVPKTEHL